MDRSTAAVLTGGALVRAALAVVASHTGSDLVQFAQPSITAYTQLKEGYHLATRLAPPLNPYDSGSVHTPPVALALVGPLTQLRRSEAATYALWIVADAVTAWTIGRIASRRRRGKLLVDNGEKVWSPARVAAIYMLHPFTITTTLARSTIAFSNLFLALALDTALDGSLIPAAFFLSLATHFSLYPLLLLPPLILLAHRAAPPSGMRLSTAAIQGTVAFGVHQLFLLGWSRWWTGSWAFLTNVYGVMLTISDLKPNIGLAWYFFIEMFDHFRAFFLVVFALHPLLYVAPFTIAYRQEPLFACTLLVGTIALLKSYPSFGDWAIWHALLGCFSEYLPYVSSPIFQSLLPLYALLLLPAFHHLWLSSGTGNANFFYAGTLVWAIAMGGWAIEAIKAAGKRELLLLQGEEGRQAWREGRWKLVQR
ncbi:hypothetical protein JCM10908_002533 [Rhodotorula pacifica]|uniref:GPI-anchor transamidase subunit GAB1 n=1 Tax=Rhodotorula pacifica TaxID=1495444 RepID=UPI00317292EB